MFFIQFLGCENIQQNSSLEMTNVITTLMSYTKNNTDDEIVDPNNLHGTGKKNIYYIL